MLKVNIPKISAKIGKETEIISFGSCFSTEVAQRMANEGYTVTNNPFGTLFNPASIAQSIYRTISCRLFTPEEVIPRCTNISKESGKAPNEGYVSFSHHGSFTRRTPEEFLSCANRRLIQTSEAFSRAKVVLITFGTAWIYRNTKNMEIVANCHKHPSYEFVRERLSCEEIVRLFTPILENNRDKEWIFTVSPIRHKKDGLHENAISKSILLIAVEQLCSTFHNTSYFPAYEIVLDELRDYSWFKEDEVHPTDKAVDYVYDKFAASRLQII